ncbi:phosphotransferase family protein [Aspergillus stella-maris]|uniref:phosphotransferase family protein n=1 Tax=Aspergillus stella-maris TaxID=1810926 RepID=UPI003CCDD093
MTLFQKLWKVRGPPHEQFISRNTISREELFADSNDRFLVNEKYQLNGRYCKFDLDALCDVVARCGGGVCPVTFVEKFEGGFSKAILMRREDRKELIVKIPCRIAGPQHLTTAAEVGTYKYLKKRTNIPVPSVIAWFSRSCSSVGAEYIVMEKASGVQSFEKWEHVPEIEKLELIRNLTQNTKDFRHENVTDDDTFCIGPEEALDRGPCENQVPVYRGTQQEHEDLLKMAISLMPALDSNAILTKYSKPTLWHTDFHMGNIYVPSQERSQITSFIDWQSISVLPMFLQARWPIFSQPLRDYKRGLINPERPAYFETFDQDEKAAAQQELKQAKLAKAYEVSASLEELFIRLGETSEVGVVPLRECLIKISHKWSLFGFSGTCPYSFTNEDIKTYEAQFAKYQEWSEGWISPHVNFEVKRKQNKELLSVYIKSVAGEKSEEEARLMWPFPE